MTDDLESKFDEEMLALYETAKVECNYNATRFRQMVLRKADWQREYPTWLHPVFRWPHESLSLWPPRSLRRSRCPEGTVEVLVLRRGNCDGANPAQGTRLQTNR